MEEGMLRAIWIKRMKWGPMDPVSQAELVVDKGLAGNANLGGRRQVTIIEQEIWEALRQRLGSDIDPASRRANLMVSGVRLVESRDRILQIGNCRVRILGETKPCERMDAALPGLRGAMFPDWSGGAFGQVVEGGTIRVGDPVRWVLENLSAVKGSKPLTLGSGNPKPEGLL
jgi:MOSC domain-containing protein YiiM